MNDFNEEELRKILRFIDSAENSCAVNFDNHLRNKIIDAIDNYCEPNPNKPNFTQDQKDFIYYQNAEWYLMMNLLLEGQQI